MSIAVIIGLGNPGDKYSPTRHNVGHWLVDEIARRAGGTFNAEKKAAGDVCQVAIAYSNVRLFKPACYMNESGLAVRRMLDFYKFTPEQMLVIHDELDLEPGTARLKKGGGHGGHNGLRDIAMHCGKDYLRMRIGIGHPGHKSQVSAYVLKPPGSADRKLIDDSLIGAERAIDVLLKDGLEKAMHFLHTAPEV